MLNIVEYLFYIINEKIDLVQINSTFYKFVFRLPEYNIKHVEAKFRLMRDIGESEDANLFQPIRSLAEELNENNILVISTPMWNLTVPYVLKQYIDIVIQPGNNEGENEVRDTGMTKCNTKFKLYFLKMLSFKF